VTPRVFSVNVPLRRLSFGLSDAAVFLGALVLLALVARIGEPIDDFLSILEAARLLGFTDVKDGDVNVTPIGRDFATTTILRSKDLFRRQILERVPLVAAIAKTLSEKESKSMPADFFMDLLDEHYAPAEVKRQFDTAVEWGRYAELFEYDADEERLSLESAAA
jgi:NitT/TauT family transport system ATP-binding protein